jgi:hypothetical protein
MRKMMIVLLLAGIGALALLPWVAQAFRPEPLLPEDLRLARQRYEETVEAAQDGTIEAIRRATSVPEIRIIGTVAGSPGAPKVKPTSAPAVAGASPTSETIAIVIQRTLPPGDAPAPVMTLPPRPTPTVAASPTNSAASPTSSAASPTSSAAASSSPTATAGGSPALPANLVDVEDILSEAQIVEQVRRDAGEDMLLNLDLGIGTDGVSADSSVTVFPGIAQHVQADGTFAVENESLVFRAASVQLNGADVTARYRDSLESRINTSLYRLLPGRFVQSFELGAGEVRVVSKMRP